LREQTVGQQGRQRGCAQTEGALSEEVATSHRQLVFPQNIHDPIS
jgi:hypothetical protein